MLLVSTSYVAGRTKSLHRWMQWNFFAERSEGQAAEWYAELYATDAPELRSISRFFGALCTRFGDPHLVENARTDLKQLRQGSMSVREYSATFCSLASKLPDWPESLLVDYFREGLNLDILGKTRTRQSSNLDWLDPAGFGS